MMRPVLVFCLALVCVSASPLWAQDNPNDMIPMDYTAAWVEVDSLERQGLPQSAQAVVDSIYTDALTRPDEVQVIKALLYRSKYKVDLEENAPNLIVADIRGLLPEVSATGQAVLHSILAELFTRYYRENRYQFYDRTATTVYDEEDLATWDIKKILTEATEHYLQSVEAADALKAVPVEMYDELLRAVPETRALRPTLYDFLAHRAIDFLMNSEAGLISPERAFILQDAAFFEPAASFVTLALPEGDEVAPGHHALRLLQDLLAFHQQRDDGAAHLHADLQRLKLVHDHSVVPTKDSLYIAGLEHLRDQHTDQLFVTDVVYALASEYQRRGNRYDARRPASPATEENRLAYRTAHALCQEAIERFPRTKGAGNCRALQNNLEQKALVFQADEVGVPQQPLLVQVQYRNVDRIYVKAVPLSYDDWEAFGETRYDEQKVLLQGYARQAGAASFPVTLPDDGDYQRHSVEISVPALEDGVYLLLAGTSADFEMEAEALAHSFLQVSAISYVSRNRKDGNHDVYVVDRETGHPLQQARIELAYFNRRSGFFSRRSYRTDRNGYAVLQPADGQSFSISITHQDQRLDSKQRFYTYRANEDEGWGHVTHFFTDRAIYRPGQTIYFKGIALSKRDGEAKIRTRFESQVRLLDVNRQEVATLSLTTNEYGTFSGSFTAPQGGLTGQMSIEDQHGLMFFSVEEYKRPRFEVTLNDPEGTSVVNDTVVVTGAAASYAGANLGGVQVAYRVVRTPNWRYWYYRWQPSNNREVEISRGVLTTQDDGTFEVAFPALPDLTLPQESNPVFNYRVHVDVTDITGETHSAETNVVVGYTALTIHLNVPEKVNKTQPPSLRVASTNLNGTFVPLQGRLVVQRLQTPDRLFRSRRWQAPDRFVLDSDAFREAFPYDEYESEADPTTWAVVDTVLTMRFDTGEQPEVDLSMLPDWADGAYRFEIHADDPTGRTLHFQKEVTLFSADVESLPLAVLDWFVPIKASGEPGEAAAFLVGSGDEDVRVLVEIEHKGVIMEQRWLTLSNSQQRIDVPLEEKHRGNLSLHVTYVRRNRAFRHSQAISVPFTNKQLKLALATFRDKMEPGSQEEWKLKISGPAGEAVAAELVAAMYDASLDAFSAHNWWLNIWPNYGTQLSWDVHSLRQVAHSTLEASSWNQHVPYSGYSYDQLNWFGFGYFSHPQIMMRMAMPAAAPAPGIVMEDAVYDLDAEVDEVRVSGKAVPMEEMQQAKKVGGEPPPPPPSLADVQARRNLNETAFFFPHLETNAEGEVVLSFTMPEALTRWRMLALAHTKDLKHGQLMQEVITQKELMVTPHAPRFFREGDTITFTAKVDNLSETLQTGQAQLLLFDALTMESLDDQLANTEAVRSFDVAQDGSEAMSWTLSIPEGVQAVTYRVVAEAGLFSDGEEAIVPVLTNRMLVTESLPLPVRGNETKTFSFDKLRNSDSPALRHHQLTLEYTPNPVWYAVQALPYLMEYPYECAEQVFSRFYANSIATHIVNQNPKIEQVYEAWRREGADALVSNLEKNQELKGLLLEATPWVLHAKDETERKRRIALLFDMNHMRAELGRALRKLGQMQYHDGSWPWFDGMPSSRWVTQYIVAGMGRLQHLGMLEEHSEMAMKAIPYLDAHLQKDYDYLKRHADNLEDQHITSAQIQYLYARSFYDQPVSKQHQEAFAYYTGQAQQYWLSQNRYLQGMIALALHRNDDKETPDAILRSLKEFALQSEEMGMYWKDPAGYFWYQAPIETQSLLIEAFHEVGDDEESVEAMKQWLLKQKQTQDWKTTKATANAVYALLLRGTDLTAEAGQVAIQLGDHSLNSDQMADAEAGTGYFKVAWDADEITPDMGEITVKKEGRGIAWGAAYWQYFEQLDRITFHETPLRLEKQVFLEQHTDTGPVLAPLDDNTTLSPGDLLKVRIVLHVDRAMEYVHMKDMRASGLEPVNVLSRYKYQDGLGYYESTRDAATDFFFGYLPKGTFVFEYPLRVAHAGDFSNGITTIQSMYAPEFTAHSEGIRIRIGE